MNQAATNPAPGEDRDWQRLDKWLWCARFMRAREDCAGLATEGHLRINRVPTDKPHARVRVGDVITLPLRGQVRVIEVLALAARRGPATAARLLYHEITEPDPAAQRPRQQPGACGTLETAPYRRP
jgi:ribosome-associated heat shock protein Hsp15